MFHNHINSHRRISMFLHSHTNFDIIFSYMCVSKKKFKQKLPTIWVLPLSSLLFHSCLTFHIYIVFVCFCFRHFLTSTAMNFVLNLLWASIMWSSRILQKFWNVEQTVAILSVFLNDVTFNSDWNLWVCVWKSIYFKVGRICFVV